MATSYELVHVSRSGHERAHTYTSEEPLVPGAVDAFKLAQRPLYFVAPFRGGAWRWEIVSLQLEHGRFTAQLGPMIVESTNGIIASPTAGN